MNGIERAIIIIIGVIISAIVFIVVQMLFPFPFGLAVGTIIAMILMYVIIKKSKIGSKSQNDDIQKLKDRVEELEKDKK